MASCWQCSADLGPLRKVEREETCGSCATWVHACKNCRFWNDSGRSCEEPAADWVHDRERANFCDFFAMRSPDEDVKKRGEEPGRGGRSAFEKLFKK